MVVGREYEIGRLEESLQADSSSLIAVYGRRRVGKTYLIRKSCEKHICFEVTGLYGGTREQQLAVFYRQLQDRSKRFSDGGEPADWEEAFELLKTYIRSLRSKQQKVIFLCYKPP